MLSSQITAEINLVAQPVGRLTEFPKTSRAVSAPPGKELREILQCLFPPRVLDEFTPYQALYPPSTDKVLPMVNVAASEQR